MIGMFDEVTIRINGQVKKGYVTDMWPDGAVGVRVSDTEFAIRDILEISSCYKKASTVLKKDIDNNVGRSII
jgi:hypothetical protein